MRILVYGINYAPEITGIGKYTAEMCAFLASQGHTVQVITAMPYYPKWEKETAYKGKGWHREIMDGVSVYRCPLFVPRRVTPLLRVLHEFSFVISSVPAWIGALFSKKYDLVICVSPPFHLGFLPLVYGALLRVPVVLHIQDLQIDVARCLGMASNPIALRLMFAAERFLFRRSAAVSTISLDMQKKIISKGISPSRCLHFPNWVDENKIHPMDRARSLRGEFGIGASERVILFSGSLGEKHGLENIIECAKSFDHQKDVRFVIVGSGEEKSKLQASVAGAGLQNVLFFPLQPYEKLSALLAIADLHLILLKRFASDLVMPSKLTSVLAAGGIPIVTAAKGSSIYDLILKHQMGIVVEPDNVQALINGITNGLKMDLRQYSVNARRYAENFLAKRAVMFLWERKLKGIAGIQDYSATTPSHPFTSMIKKKVETGVRNA